jgi:proline dehydrogenase
MMTNYINRHEIFQRLLYGFSKKWLGGYDKFEAISYAKIVNLDGVFTIINYLGEGITELEQVEKNFCEYLSLLNQMSSRNIYGSISIKPTQFGVDLNYDYCVRMIRKLVQAAFHFNYFVWLDMESVLHVDNTLSIYLDIFRYNANVGVALQAYLIRSRSDLLHLIEYGSNIRLVKGAYHNSRKVAYQSKKEIRANFFKLMEMLFTDNHKAILAIATHDTHIINYALTKCEKYPETISYVEFQFLKEVKSALKKHLLENHYKVCEYVPYGRAWLPFVLRRIKERKREIIYHSASMIK